MFVYVRVVISLNMFVCGIVAYLTFVFKHFYDYSPLIKSYIFNPMSMRCRLPISFSFRFTFTSTLASSSSPLPSPPPCLWFWYYGYGLQWWMMSFKNPMQQHILFDPDTPTSICVYPVIDSLMGGFSYFFLCAFTSWVNQKISMWCIYNLYIVYELCHVHSNIYGRKIFLWLTCAIML